MGTPLRIMVTISNEEDAKKLHDYSQTKSMPVATIARSLIIEGLRKL